MKNRHEFEDDIPLGHTLFLVREGVRGAEMIPELKSFQVDGKLFDPDELEEGSLEEEMFSALDHLRFLLKSRTEERHS